MDVRLIKLFGVALVENEKMSMAQFRIVNKLAAEVGYFVHPDVCNESVMEFLHNQEINPNATFYKEWEDVTSKTRLELLFDQVFHYLTTYGTDFSMGNGYVPNDGAENVPAIKFELFKTIMPISRKELFEKCWNMICSGVALKEETMKAVSDFILEEVKNGTMIDVDEIKNREAQIYICTTLNIWPSNPTALFRMIMLLTTGNAMIVNNNTTIRTIEHAVNPFNFNKLDERSLEKLSSIFLRFKNLFLAFKHNNHCDNKSVINKLRKLAIKNHKPFIAGFWQTLFSKPKDIENIKAHLNELTNYKKVALMQTCLERIGNNENRIYVVRNGKIFFKEGCKLPENNMSYYVNVYNVLRESVIEALHANSLNEAITFDIETEGITNPEPIVTKVPKVVKVYNGLNVTLPTSEKSFIGNYPFGTSYDLLKDNFVACYWRNEWGTQDYDLSLIDSRGGKIGWNSEYYNKEQNIVYSGDMTSAEPDACEVIKIKNPKDLMAVVKINQFYGGKKSKFEVLFGQSNKTYKSYDHYMVDPNDIKFKATVEHENQREMQIALIADNKATLMEVHSGNNIVSRTYNKAEDYMKALVNKTKYFVSAKELLEEAGYKIVDESYTGDVDIDMANLDKDTLIALMV